MQSIMQDLSGRYNEMLGQISRGFEGKEGEGIVINYHDILVKPSPTDDMQEIIRQISLDHSIDHLEFIVNYVNEVTSELEKEEEKVRKCITLPQPAQAAQCKVM